MSKRFVRFPLMSEVSWESRSPETVEACVIELDCREGTFKFVEQPGNSKFHMETLQKLVPVMLGHQRKYWERFEGLLKRELYKAANDREVSKDETRM